MAKRKWIRVGFDLKPLPPPALLRWEIDTREKAVAHLIRLLSRDGCRIVRETKREDLIGFHLSSWGMGIRKELGLWGENVYLLRDLSPDKPIHADDASMILIRAVWEQLQEQGPNRAEQGEPAK
jgi:hypothetical protein